MRAFNFAAIVATAPALAITAPVDAQQQVRTVTRGPTTVTRHGPTWTGPRAPMPNAPHRSRWGGNVNGRWYAGVYAPGGWTSYRRPVRGWTLPSYWVAPTFYVTDYAAYGLGAPPAGYNWSRYYDDAVLVNNRGRVFDSVSGLDWEGYDAGGEQLAYAEPPVAPVHAPPPPPPGVAYAPPPGVGYAPPPPPAAPSDHHRGPGGDNGVGGALIGGAVGGVAGNVIAGKGNRLAGTLIGAGVGAIAGAAIDQAEDRGKRRPKKLKRPKYPPQPYGYGYPDDGYDHGYPAGGYAPPPVVFAPPAEVVQHAYAPGYDSSAYYGAGAYTNVYYGPGTMTTVTVIPGTTTTTETEYVYETVAARSYAKKRVYRARAKARQCNCVCKVVCR